MTPFFGGTESFAKFYGVEELMYFCEADIKQLGVRNSAHRARIVSSLVAFRDKYDNGNKQKHITSPLSHFHTRTRTHNAGDKLLNCSFLFRLKLEFHFFVSMMFIVCARMCMRIFLTTHRKVVICETIYLEHVC